MNPKLIIASIAGVSTLGGGVAGGYYYFKTDTSNFEKQTISETTNSGNQQQSVSPSPTTLAGNSDLSSQPNARADSVSTRREATSPDVASRGGDSGSSSSTGTGGVAATGVAASGVESGSRPTTTVDTLNRVGSVSQSPDGGQVSRT